ncbi:MAG: hypothetical protein IJ733_10890 [Lachnospiraceae bacterium]|nr:hypothetical protein [Lachnospiraceae bacterium]
MKKYKKTIAECSKSDSGKALIDDETEVYSLDYYAEDLGKTYRSKKKYPASVDAFLMTEDHRFVFMEFKNARKSKITYHQLASKTFDSMYLAQLFLGGKYSLETMAKSSALFVVYQDGLDDESQKENDSASFERFKEKVGELAKISENHVLFDLEKFKGWLYKDIYTIGQDEFRKSFLPKIHS